MQEEVRVSKFGEETYTCYDAALPEADRVYSKLRGQLTHQQVGQLVREGCGAGGSILALRWGITADIFARNSNYASDCRTEGRWGVTYTMAYFEVTRNTFGASGELRLIEGMILKLEQDEDGDTAASLLTEAGEHVYSLALNVQGPGTSACGESRGPGRAAQKSGTRAPPVGRPDSRGSCELARRRLAQLAAQLAP
jgi:hypothetical protein